MPTRPATPADIPAILAIERKSSTAAHWTEEQYRRGFESSVPRRVMMVIELESSVAGFLVARGVEREWEIENIVVRRSFTRRGLGKRLLSALVDEARQQGGRSVRLEVRESNAAARSLYANAGFLETGRRREYYREPVEDSIEYCLTIAAGGPITGEE